MQLNVSAKRLATLPVTSLQSLRRTIGNYAYSSLTITETEFVECEKAVARIDSEIERRGS